MKIWPLVVFTQSLDSHVLWMYGLFWRKKLAEMGWPPPVSQVASDVQISVCSLTSKGQTQTMYKAVRFNKCCLSDSEGHSYPLNKHIVNLRIRFPASDKMNTIFGSNVYISEIK